MSKNQHTNDMVTNLAREHVKSEADNASSDAVQAINSSTQAEPDYSGPSVYDVMMKSVEADKNLDNYDAGTKR